MKGSINTTENIFELIDVLVTEIKKKDVSQSFFSKKIIEKFDFEFILCMEIVRYELQLNDKLSDLTADAVGAILGMMAFHYYDKDYPEIGRQCNTLLNGLVLYNEKSRKFDLPAKVRLSEAGWVRFFRKAIKTLVLDSEGSSKMR
jgi:hypothetical protein